MSIDASGYEGGLGSDGFKKNKHFSTYILSAQYRIENVATVAAKLVNGANKRAKNEAN